MPISAPTSAAILIRVTASSSPSKRQESLLATITKSLSVSSRWRHANLILSTKSFREIGDHRIFTALTGITGRPHLLVTGQQRFGGAARAAGHETAILYGLE